MRDIVWKLHYNSAWKWQKVHKLGLCGHFWDLKSTPLGKPTALKFSTDKDYISKLYLAQFETHQNYHFQIIGQNMWKV